MAKTDLVQKLEKKYNFTIKRSKSDRFVDIIEFTDGRRYTLRHPPFLELHRMMVGSENLDHDIFLYGLENLTPDNEKSSVINEEWMESHRGEAIGLWSPLLRNVLLLE